MTEHIHEKIEKLTSILKGAKSKANTNPEEAIKDYLSIIQDDLDNTKNEQLIKIKEDAIYGLGELYGKLKRPQDIFELNKSIRPFFKDLPKAKTAKIVKSLLEDVGLIPGTLDTQIEFAKESIEWAQNEKRTFLRQRIETRLATLYFEKEKYTLALDIINKLLHELKRIDDKALLVEVQLLESRVYHALKNLSKSRAALTSARTAANAIYCPPLLQANIDLQSGILHAEEKDYKTGYSYFYEAFEGFHGLDNPLAVISLKYMLLCKIVTNDIDDIQKILSGKNALKYTGNDILAMKAVAGAYQERSLHSFEETLKQYKNELLEDPLIKNHVNELYDKLLEQHLLRIIEPFSKVQIAHIAKLIDLDVEKVERKLSYMILDKKLNGILDQGNGSLIVFEEETKDDLYPTALEIIENMNSATDSLFERAKELTKIT